MDASTKRLLNADTLRKIAEAESLGTQVQVTRLKDSFVCRARPNSPDDPITTSNSNPNIAVTQTLDALA